MTYEEIMDLPFNKQVWETAKLYCMVNKKTVFKNKRLSAEFCMVRNYFMSPKRMIPRQNIKNIWKWLNDKRIPCSIYDLNRRAMQYVSQCIAESEKEKAKALNVKQHDLSDSLEDFLGL